MERMFEGKEGRKTMNRIVRILMNRDGMTESEAKSLYKEVRAEFNDAVAAGDYELAEEIMACDLGLEMDYIFDML